MNNATAIDAFLTTMLGSEKTPPRLVTDAFAACCHAHVAARAADGVRAPFEEGQISGLTRDAVAGAYSIALPRLEAAGITAERASRILETVRMLAFDGGI